MNAALSTGLLVGGAILAYNAFTKAGALQSLNFYPKSITDIRFQGVTPVMRLGLAIQNTTNQRLIVRSLAGNLYSNTYLIGNISTFSPLAINPNSETVLQITVRLSLLGIVQDIIDAFNGNGLQQKIVFDARANIDRYQVPINIKYTVG